MKTNFGARPKSEVILVSKAVAIANAVKAGDFMYDSATNEALLADGQLGIVCDTHSSSTRAFGEFIDTTDTAINVDEIRIVQGTPKSGDLTSVDAIPLGHQAVVKSHKIKANGGVIFTAKVAKQSHNDAWVIGAASGAGAILPVSEKYYKLNLQFLSKRKDKEYSVSGNENLTIAHTSPDYTTLSIAQPLDHLVKNLVFNANLNSFGLRYNIPALSRGKRNVIAFAINFAGGAGTALSAITAGTQFPVVVSGGSPVNFLPNTDFVATIANVIANGASSGITGASTIEVVDLATAGTSAAAQGILLVTLDEKLAYAKDETPQVKVRLNLGFETEFKGSSVAITNLSKPFEGEGKGRVWKLEYEKRAQLNQYTQQNRMYGHFYVEVPDYIDATKDYTAYIIESKDEYDVAYSHVSEYGHRTIILVPAVNEVTNATVAGGLNTYLGQWLTSVRSLGKLEASIPPAASFFI